MKEAVTQFLGQLLWGLIEGSSVIILDRERGRVGKIQRSRIFIRILNFLAFQRWSTLYEREVGLRIAICRREIAHWVLLCGSVRCRVAPCLGIESWNGRLALVTRLIEGRQPNREEIVATSREVTILFLHAGLSVWPVCTFHPRFHTNFVIDEEDVPWIVDLESHVPGIFVPFEELWDNLLIGNFPPFDDIHFPKLWIFYREESGSLPRVDRERFKTLIEECEQLTRRKKSGELRVWSRILSVLFRAARLKKEWER